MHKTIDCRGLSCPLPVVNTKKTLEKWSDELAMGRQIVSIVDNETAAANVQRMVEQAGYRAMREEKDDGIYISILPGALEEKPAAASELPADDPCRCACESTPGVEPEVVFLVTSSLLGKGDEELGRVLMTSFMNSFLDGSQLPSKILFMNSGVFLTVEGSPVLESLGRMVEQGVQVLSCGTCLDFYNVKDKLNVGEITNMYDTVETLSSPAFRCVTI